MDLYRKLAGYLRRYSGYIAISLLWALVFVAFHALSIWLLGSFLGSIFLGSSASALTGAANGAADVMNAFLQDVVAPVVGAGSREVQLRNLFFLLWAVIVVKDVCYFLNRALLMRVQACVTRDIRRDLFHHLLTLPVAYFNRTRSGDLYSILVGDAEKVRQALAETIHIVCVQPLKFGVLLVILFMISAKLTLLFMVALPLIFFLLRLIGQGMRIKTQRTRRHYGELTELVKESVSGIRLVKAFGVEALFRRLFGQSNEECCRLETRQYLFRAMSSPLISSVTFTALLVIFLYAALVEMSRELTAPQLIQFVLFMGMVLVPLKALTDAHINIQEALASLGRIFEVLDVTETVPEDAHAVALTAFTDRIEFRNVSFRYESGAGQALSSVSFSLKKGQVVALVGSSGAGKTTLVNLLMRFFDVTEGGIYLDGRDIRTIRLASLRSLISLVPQETLLFNDTIRRNIVLDKTVTDAELREAARSAHALEFIEALPKGFDTVIGERGVRLSGGQRQRLAIARAILRDSPILILDEATSSLDSESEQKIQQAMENLKKDRTVMVIAHRLSTVRNASVILVLEDGCIAESGSHEELLAMGGRYHRFYLAQFEKEADRATE